MTIGKMKTKIFGLFALSILTLVFLMGAVSAAITLYPNSYSKSIQQGDSASFNFKIYNDGGTSGACIGNCTLVNIISVISDLTGSSGTISSSQILIGTLPNSVSPQTNNSNIPITINIPLTQAIGTYNGTITIGGKHNETGGTIGSQVISLLVTVTPTLTEESICAFDDGVTTNIGNYLKVNIKDITVTDGFGDDEDWLLLDEVEVEIKVENKGLKEYDVDDISLEWGIANDDLTDWAVDFDEIDEFDLKDDDQETFTITFKIDDDDLDMDLDELSDLNYNLVVRATGIVDDEDDLLTVDDTCAADFKEISIYEESDFVILDNIDMPEIISCGETVTITADVWNIGNDEQKDVSVEISGRESALDFRETFEIGDIDEFDRQQISFTFTVPQNIDEKFYALNFEVNDDDGEVYENDFDEDEAEFTVPFKVEGNCGVGIADVIISANLESEAKAGKEMIIRATVANNGDELKTFTINAAEFAAWADLISQDQNILILNAGQSRDVLFTFDVKKDASGSQTFFIELTSDGDVTRQSVSVNVESARPFLGITGFVTTDNAYLWGIGILNIIIIVIIIIVAVRIARRK